MSEKKVQEKTNLKNYYGILGVTWDATKTDIEKAYHQLSKKWHPDNHKTDRHLADKKFHQITQAYDVLSDQSRRCHYDDMLRYQFSLEDANETFENFFGEHGLDGEDQQKFFKTHYPETSKDYYRILGVPRNATFDQIKKAYRKLAIQYHPKNNPDNKDFSQKFIQVNQAFNALKDEFKRKTYDDVLFGQITPFKAHNIFDDFFGKRLFDMDLQDQFMKPMWNKKWKEDMWDLEKDFDTKEIKDGEAYKQNVVYHNKNGVESKKTVTNKKKVVDGKVIEQKTEQFSLPNGVKQITKTIKDGDKVQTKKWELKKGEELPKELTN